MSDHNSILKALQKLKPLAEFTLRGTELEWLDSKQTEPSQDEINTEIERQKKEFADNQYQRDRLQEYPSLQECIHAILDDDLATLQAKRTVVKNKYPKPE